MGRKKFLQDERAVSPVLGFILVAAVGISMLTYVQVHSVPVWNTEIEFHHMDAVYEEMMYTASDIEDVAISGVPKSSDIPLGVEYPSRGILRNPRPGMVGTLSVSSNQAITINYTMSGVEYNKTYSSCSIRYMASGTTMHPTLVYEHGIVIRDFGEYGNSTACEQTLLSGDNINLVISTGSYSSSSMETGRLPIYSNNAGSETVSGNITTVTIMITTNYTNIWKNLLDGKNTTNTTISFSENKIIINSTAIKEISLPEMDSSFSGIYAGVAKFSTETSATGGGGSSYTTVAIDLSADPTSIPADGVTTSEITATVTSEGSPVKFVSVGFGVTPSDYTVSEDIKITNISGIAEVTLHGSTTVGQATVYATVGTLFDTVVVEFTELLIPTVTTTNATDVGNTKADLNMDYDFKGYTGDVRFRYKPSGGLWTNTSWESESGSGSYQEKITGLSPGTIYDFEAQLQYDSTIINGGEKTFTTTT